MAMCSQIDAMLGGVRGALAGAGGAVQLAQLDSLAKQQNFHVVPNLFCGTDVACAALAYTGHQQCEVRVAQEGPGRAQLSAAEAASAMANHALSDPAGASPLFGDLLTSFLAYAASLTAALRHISTARWAELAGNLRPVHIVEFGTPTQVLRGALVLLSQQVAVQARFIPHNFSGDAIAAEFVGVREASKGTQLTVGETMDYMHHCAGVKPIPKFKADSPPTDLSDNMIKLLVWGAPQLSDVFEDPTVICSRIQNDSVYSRLMHGASAGPLPITPMTVARAVGFNRDSPAFTRTQILPRLKRAHEPPALRDQQALAVDSHPAGAHTRPEIGLAEAPAAAAAPELERPAHDELLPLDPEPASPVIPAAYQDWQVQLYNNSHPHHGAYSSPEYQGTGLWAGSQYGHLTTAGDDDPSTYELMPAQPAHVAGLPAREQPVYDTPLLQALVDAVEAQEYSQTDKDKCMEILKGLIDQQNVAGLLPKLSLWKIDVSEGTQLYRLISHALVVQIQNSQYQAMVYASPDERAEAHIEMSKQFLENPDAFRVSQRAAYEAAQPKRRVHNPYQNRVVFDRSAARAQPYVFPLRQEVQPDPSLRK